MSLRPLFLIPLMAACFDFSNGGDREEADPGFSEWSGGSDGGGDTDTGNQDSTIEDTADTEDTGFEDTGDGGGDDGGGDDTQMEPRAPGYAELVISELMVNPAAVDDSAGEYVELYNPTADSLLLDGVILADLDSDAVVLPDGLVLEPGEYLVLCAQDHDNGGVSCDATFPYGTTGGAFAMANTGDEVVLWSAAEELIDFVEWSDGTVAAGKAMGFTAGTLDATRNDDLASACAQQTGLSGGDWGTPGVVNDGCN